MSRFLVTPLAERDLEEVVDYIATETGADQAGATLDDLLEAMEHLATSPRMGHRRADLTDGGVRFWIVHPGGRSGSSVQPPCTRGMARA